MDYKQQKKQWKKGRAKAVRPFKGIAIASLVLGVLTVGIYALDSFMLNAFTCLMGDSTSRLVGEDKSAQYFVSDFSDKQERVDYESKLVEEIAKEGAVLLKNDNALPLAKGGKVSCFSTSSVNLVYGGTGSGAVDASKAPTLKQALEGAGLTVNETLWNFYKTGAGSKYKRANGSMLGDAAATGEAPWSAYPNDVLASVEGSDAAIVVFSRIGGESVDLETRTRNYLALDENELSMLQGISQLKAEGKVGKIVVLLNSSNAIQLDFLKGNPYGIDSVMWIGGVGSTGINGVASLLVGDTSPSGCLPDTFLYDNMAAPAMVNFNTSVYEGAEEAGLNNNQKYYVVYQEGIYVGYKYFETRYEDKLLNQGNAGDFDYDSVVAYPFGYGMSYSQFEYSNTAVTYDAAKDEYTVSVTVTNTGAVAAKRTVQVYLQSPYTQYDKDNKIEKSSVSLVGFEKTDKLARGASQTVEVKVDGRELACYDANGAKTYLLEAGTYYFGVGNGAHEAVQNIVAYKNGETEVPVVTVEQATTDQATYSVSHSGTTITNLFDSADLKLYEGSPKKDITYLSRSDWEGTYPKETVKLGLTPKLIEDLGMQIHENKTSTAEEMPVTGADKGISAYDMMNEEFGTQKWKDYISQMTVDELVNFVGNAFHLTYGVQSAQLPQTRQENGPQGYTGFFGIGGNDPMAITSCDLLAATYNRELVADVGRCIGNDCLEDGISALYGPGSNIHRTPYGGRNFEYYSEDGFLSAEIGAVENAAISAKGVMVEIKHFVCNDCEENRAGLGTWLNEQSLREIYLKAFEKVFKVTPMAGVMNGYDRLGATWCGSNKALLTDLLRGEWGCMGFIITDNCVNTYMNGVDGVLAGSALFDAMMPYVKGHLTAAKGDAEVVEALQQAAMYNAYAIVNSCAMNGIGANTKVVVQNPVHNTVLGIASIVLCLAFVGCTAMWIIRDVNYKKQNPKPVK